MKQHAKEVGKQITKIIQKEYGIDVMNPTRQRDVVELRIIAFMILRLEGINNYTISQTFGKNHATVTHAFKILPDLYKYSAQFRKKHDRIFKLFGVKKEIANDCIKCLDIHQEHRDEIKALKNRVQELKETIREYRNNPLFETIDRVPETEIENVNKKIKTHLNGIGGAVYIANAANDVYS